MSVFVTKALQQVWCSPEMDYQRIFSLGRLTRSGGILRNIAILFDYVDMPTVNERYHVFQLGNRTTSEMGIHTRVGDDWISLLALINREEMQLDVYTDLGTILPAKDIYLRKTDSTNLILVIRDRGNLFGERDEGVFLRSYRNAWFSTAEANSLNVNTFMMSTQVRTLAHAAEVINTYQEYVNRRGQVRVTIDGKLSTLSSVASIPMDSHVDIFYDGAVHWTTVLPVKDLKMYYSTLDKTEKFIIHPKKSLTGGDEILYHDDVDFYVVTGNGTSRRGLFLHSNQKESQRMLTHNDYAIRVSHVNALCTRLGVNPDNCAIQMVIRRGGINRELSYERHFIHELYKLPDEEIIDILAEEKTTVEYWTAECLENAYYTKIMRSGLIQITEDDALKAFGYGGCTVETMQSPIKLNSSATVNRPIGFRGEVVTIATTRLNNWSDIQYLNPSNSINGQQWVDGVMDFRLASKLHRRKVYYNIDAFDLPNHLSFTAYRAVKENGVRSGDWEEVTYTNDYAYENGRFKWLIELPLYDVMVVPGDYSDLMVLSIDYPAEVLIDLSQTHNTNGYYIPTAEIRVVADQQLLTYGVDFIVSGGFLQITNLEIGRKTNVLVKVLRLGCETDRPRSEHGFVMGGALSHNGRYDLHGSSVKSVTCGDMLIAHDEQAYAETGETSSLLQDGKPYEMLYYRGPIDGVAWWKVKDLREDWDKTFQVLEDYLSARLTETDTVGTVTIPEPIWLFSPFMHRIVNDLASGKLNISKGPMMDDLIEYYAEAYMHLLRYDPIKSSRYDKRFIGVAPIANTNMVTLSEDELYFVKRLNERHLDGVLTFTNFIEVSNE